MIFVMTLYLFVLIRTLNATALNIVFKRNVGCILFVGPPFRLLNVVYLNTHCKVIRRRRCCNNLSKIKSAWIFWNNLSARLSIITQTNGYLRMR